LTNFEVAAMQLGIHFKVCTVFFFATH
jgi:hypothetical protein